MSSKALGTGQVLLRELPKSGQTVSVKGQIINIFSFVDKWFIKTIQLPCESVKPALDEKMITNGYGHGLPTAVLIYDFTWGGNG